LQFKQEPPTGQKLQKSLPFFPPARIHFSSLKGFKTPTLKKLKPQTAVLPCIWNKKPRQDFNLTKCYIFDM
jgi:hypothetical protein